MSGGPMYFMKNADFRLFGKKVNLKWVGIMFAFATVLSSFGTGSLPQINSISNSIYSLIAELMNKNVEIICENDRLRPEMSEVQRLYGDNKKLKKLQFQQELIFPYLSYQVN